MVDKGVDINKKYGYFKETYLAIAVKEGHLDIIKFLMDKGCDLDYDTIIPLACEYGHLHILKLLLEICFKDNISVNLESLINRAFKKSHMNIINYIFELWIKDRKYDLVIKHNEYVGIDNHLIKLSKKMIQGIQPFLNKRKMFPFDCVINI